MLFSPGTLDELLPEPCVALKDIMLAAKTDTIPNVLTMAQNHVKQFQEYADQAPVFDYDEIQVNLTADPLAGCGFCSRQIRCCK